MKSLLALIAAAHAAHADCTLAQNKAAVKALTGATFVEFRRVKTLNTPSDPAPARRVSTSGDAVQIDGRRVDLADIYVQTPHHDFANLAVTVGCPTKAEPTYDPRSECQKWDDELADGEREVANPPKLEDRKKAEANAQLAQMRVMQAQTKLRVLHCHLPGATVNH